MSRLLRLLVISLVLAVLLAGGVAAGPGHSSAGIDGDPETPMLAHPGGKVPVMLGKSGVEHAAELVEKDSRDLWVVLLRAYWTLVRALTL